MWIYLRKLHKLSIQIRNLKFKLAEEFEFRIKYQETTRYSERLQKFRSGHLEVFFWKFFK